MRVEGQVSHKHDPAPPGAWLQHYDPEYADGRGSAEWTMEKDEAMAFETVEAAFLCYQQVSVKRPIRPDGRPNRPLTAFSVEVVEI